VINGFSVLYLSVLKYQHNLNKHISAYVGYNKVNEIDVKVKMGKHLSSDLNSSKFETGRCNCSFAV